MEEESRVDRSKEVKIQLSGRHNLVPKTPTQGDYIKALHTKELVIAVGPAGTGKTHIAVAQAVSLYLKKKIDTIIITRPTVSAGEKLGYLPGDINEKMDPFMRPIYDSLQKLMTKPAYDKAMKEGRIEVAPLAFCRGRTFEKSFMILDEAQNTTKIQMKMFLTRMGEGSRMVVTGDTTQVDLPANTKNGLEDLLPRVVDLERVSVVKFKDSDVMRHPLVADIIRVYKE